MRSKLVHTRPHSQDIVKYKYFSGLSRVSSLNLPVVPALPSNRESSFLREGEFVAYLVYVTTPGKKYALELARALVEARLAAGVNVLPGAVSVYRWRDEIRQAEECLLFAQVSRAAFPNFCEVLRQRHCYEIPCVVALPIDDGHVPFMRWIEENSLS
jgi:periplasmic divalent cation tolerance protein